jgi:hypothetical protein
VEITYNGTSVNGKWSIADALAASFGSEPEASWNMVVGFAPGTLNGEGPVRSSATLSCSATTAPVDAATGDSKAAPPPPSPPPPASVVSVELALAGIDPATFDAADVASGIAEASGVDLADVVVTVEDLPVATTLSLVGSSTLSNAQRTSMATAITAALPSAAQAAAVVTIGTPTAVRRRLLDLTVPVTITGLGAASATATAASSALQSSSSLAAFATAGGATSASASVPGAHREQRSCMMPDGRRLQALSLRAAARFACHMRCSACQARLG